MGESRIVDRQFDSIAEIDLAISKLRRRIDQLGQVDPTTERLSGNAWAAAEANAIKTAREVFGLDSHEASEFGNFMRAIRRKIRAGMTAAELRADFTSIRLRALSMVSNWIQRLEESKLDLESDKPTRAPNDSAVSLAPPVGANRIFLGHGHSREWYALRDFIERKIGYDCVEFSSVETAGVSTKERSDEMLDQCGFAFLIMTGEDERNGELHARENVVHEVGLFQGRLGWRKAIVMLEDGARRSRTSWG